MEARAILAHTPRAVARDWSKLLESAVANAEHNHELVGEDLYVKAVHADEGPTAKRFRPRAHGSRHEDSQAHRTPDDFAHAKGLREQNMGQKVHPESMRVGYIHDWKSNWFNEKNFADYLHEDTQIREHINGRLAHAGLSDITIRKNATEVEVNIHTARPGIVIGKSGSEVDQLRRDLHRITGKQVKVNILEIKRPELDARLVAQSIAEQLQNRVAFRRAMKRALTSAMRSGAKGVKVQVSGRLGGAEMARTEGYSDGRVPLHTLRADIDYGFHEARTTFGRIGVKCWINKGEIMPEGYSGADLTIMDDPAPQAPDRGGRDGRQGRDGRGGRGGSGRSGWRGRSRSRPRWFRRSRRIWRPGRWTWSRRIWRPGRWPWSRWWIRWARWSGSRWLRWARWAGWSGSRWLRWAGGSGSWWLRWAGWSGWSGSWWLRWARRSGSWWLRWARWTGWPGSRTRSRQGPGWTAR